MERVAFATCSNAVRIASRCPEQGLQEREMEGRRGRIQREPRTSKGFGPGFPPPPPGDSKGLMTIAYSLSENSSGV